MQGHGVVSRSYIEERMTGRWDLTPDQYDADEQAVVDAALAVPKRPTKLVVSGDEAAERTYVYVSPWPPLPETPADEQC